MDWVRANGGKFSNMSPDELIEYQKNVDNGSQYDILDMVQRYTLSLNGLRLNTKLRYYTMVRSFFSHNRASLPSDPGFKLRGDKPKVEGILTVEMVRDIVLGSKKVYRAIILSMFQGALDHEMFQYWNVNGLDSLRSQLDDGFEIIKIDLPGRKNNRNDKPYYTFIGTDAIKAIREYLEVRPEHDKNGNPTKGTFLNQYRRPITANALRMYWMRQLKKHSIIEPTPELGRASRYGTNIHELRDLFKTQFSRSPADKWFVGEFFMGHQIDSLEYDKSFRYVDLYREQYRKAMPYLNIISDPTSQGLVNESRTVSRSEYEELQRKYNSLLDERIQDYEDYKKFKDDVMRQIRELQESVKK